MKKLKNCRGVSLSFKIGSVYHIYAGFLVETQFPMQFRLYMNLGIQRLLSTVFRIVALSADSRAFSLLMATILSTIAWAWLEVVPRISVLPLFISLTLSFSLTLHGFATICMTIYHPTVCNVRLLINQEVTLIYRSWWPRNLAPDEVRRLAEDAAVQSAQSWYETSEASSPRMVISAEEARHLTSQYLANEDSSDPDNPCCICLEKFQSSATTLKVCSHRYHADCIANWFAKGKLSCPYCRSDQSICVPVEVQARHFVKREPSISVLSTDVRRGSAE